MLSREELKEKVHKLYVNCHEMSMVGIKEELEQIECSI